MPLDIGIGILLSLGVAEFFHTHATPFFVLLGILCALLPDIDVVTIPLFGRWHHRTHTHYPLVYLPVVIIAFVLVPPMYATLFTLGVHAHLAHDTFGIGWGIAWLWPFSKRKFLLFPAKDRSEFTGIFATWLPHEEPKIRTAGRRANWIQHYYFRPNPLAYIEYGTLFIALVALALYV